MSNEESPTKKPFGPIHDRIEYERQLDSLPEPRREIALELTRFADTCQFFEQKGIEVPPQISRAMADVSKLPDSERAAAVFQINQQLMEYLNGVDRKDDGVRH